jgi:lambda repressor-like predicted transcriptional regulator
MNSNTVRNKHLNAMHNKLRNVGAAHHPIQRRRPCSNRVRIMLLRRGLSYAEVARRLGVSNRSTIARVVYGHYILPEVREGIAGLLGVPAERLWRTDSVA